MFVVLPGLNVSVWTYALRPRDLDIYFLDVGQGDAAFLRFPNCKTMVVDGGERSERFDYGARVLRTDRTGAVRVRIDGVSMAVETMIE